MHFIGTCRVVARRLTRLRAGTCVCLLLTLVLVPIAAPDTFAQGVDVSVTWTSDYTVIPWVSTTSRSGPVAGQAAVRVLFTPPPYCVGAVVKKLIVHEDAGHVQDLGGDNLNAPMTWVPSLGKWDYGLSWPTHAGHHNSPYTITAQVTYQVMRFFPPPPVPASYTTPDTTINVTPANLIVTATSPANPETIQWDPDTMSSVTVAASASCAYREEQPATLAIYRSDQTLVKTMQQMLVVGPGSVPVQFAWDGSQDPPAVGIAPKGIYLFTWTVGGIGQTPPTTDSDKSTFLMVTTTEPEAELVSDDGTTAVYNVSYTLTSAPSRSATEGKIDVYDPELDLHNTTALEAADLTPGAHAVVLTVPSPERAGAYVFLISANDDHDDKDRAHRIRWALQHNQRDSPPPTIGFTHYDGAIHGRLFAGSMKRMGYKRHPNSWEGGYYDWYQESPTITMMRRVLEDQKVALVNGQKQLVGYFNPKRLKTLLLSGHGKDPYALLLDGNPVAPNPSPGSQRYLVPTWYYQSHPWIQQQNCLLLESVQPGPSPFSNIDLVFLVGCDLDPLNDKHEGDATGSLAMRFFDLGAQFVIVSGWTAMPAKANQVFLSEFFLPNLEKGMTILEANTLAIRRMNSRYHGAQWLKDHDYYNNWCYRRNVVLKRPE